MKLSSESSLEVVNIFTVWDYDTQTVTRYKRTGECNLCGYCCERTIKFSIVSSDDPDSKRQDGLITFHQGKWVEVGEGEERVFYRMKEQQEGVDRCIHLGCDNRCAKYEDRYPLCRTWPHTPNDLIHIPECSYTFERLDQCRFDELKHDD